MPDPIPLVDLQAQRRRLDGRIERAIARVLDHGRFILGPEVADFEARLAGFCGVAHAVGCASGTDALLMALMAWEVGRGDAVFVPGFTFASTAEVVALLGATPVFVDVRPDTFNLDVASLAQALDDVDRWDLRPRAVVPVDLFGQPADYAGIEKLAASAGMSVLADAAQSLGGRLDDSRVGALAAVTATSFFPAKPLGCYGDGGAVLTDDSGLADVIRSLRVHGQGADKYDNVRVGVNGRLDTIQAAVLIEKLAIFDEELAARQRVAERYAAALAGVVETPAVAPGTRSAWAQYTVLVDDRDRVAAELARAGVQTAIYYVKPLHLQPAYRALPTGPGGLPVCEELAGRVLSLPMHPYLTAEVQDRVIEVVREAVG